jgi:ABC-type cobalamin transport system ATPase subunit
MLLEGRRTASLLLGSAPCCNLEHWLGCTLACREVARHAPAAHQFCRTLAEDPPVDAVRWHQALQQLVTTLHVTCSACMAALTVKGSLTQAKLSAIVSLVTATLDGCAALLLRGPPADSLSREQQQRLREVLMSPLLGYGTCLVLSCSNSVSLARRLGHGSMVKLLNAGPASPGALPLYAAAFVRHALTADGRLQATNQAIRGSTLWLIQPATSLQSAA